MVGCGNIAVSLGTSLVVKKERGTITLPAVIDSKSGVHPPSHNPPVVLSASVHISFPKSNPSHTALLIQRKLLSHLSFHSRMASAVMDQNTKTVNIPNIILQPSLKSLA